jgi:hypothetical protein
VLGPAHSVLAGFIFLYLLKRDAEFLGEGRLAHPHPISSSMHPGTDVIIDSCSGSRIVLFRLFHAATIASLLAKQGASAYFTGSATFDLGEY